MGVLGAVALSPTPDHGRRVTERLPPHVVVVIHDSLKPIVIDDAYEYQDPTTGEWWRPQRIARGVELTWTFGSPLPSFLVSCGVKRYQVRNARVLASFARRRAR